jgi:hypothetical protein
MGGRIGTLVFAMGLLLAALSCGGIKKNDADAGGGDGDGDAGISDAGQVDAGNGDCVLDQSQIDNCSL